jgi:crotonobetainyl-CoA:carnitine CoA-transferase CaiB-like acyl-CoA transferase
MPGNPVKLSELNDQEYSPPPVVGEHTAEILRDYLKLSRSDIAALMRDGIIA